MESVTRDRDRDDGSGPVCTEKSDSAMAVIVRKRQTSQSVPDIHLRPSPQSPRKRTGDLALDPRVARTSVSDRFLPVTM